MFMDAFFKRILCFIFLTMAGLRVMFSQQITITDFKIHGVDKNYQATLSSYLKKKQPIFLDSLDIKNDLLRLKRLPAISHVSFRVEMQSSQTCILHYNVVRQHTLIPVVNLWRVVKNRLAYKLGGYEYNFLQKNMTLGLEYTYNGYSSYGLYFRAPFVFSNSFGIAFNVSDITSEEPLYFNSSSANYTYRNKSVEVGLLFENKTRHYFSMGANFFKEHYQYLSGATDASIPLELKINKYLAKFNYKYDAITFFYHLLDGFKNEFTIQYVDSPQMKDDTFWMVLNEFFI